MSVFYDIDPSLVRNQTRCYKLAFEKHRRELKHNNNKLQKWKAALKISDSIFSCVNLDGLIYLLKLL